MHSPGESKKANPDWGGGRIVSSLRTDFGKACAVLAVCYTVLLGSLWSYGIMDPSDGWYAEPAREMLERGEFLTPLLNYEPFYEKPIGVYWAILASYKLFGVHEFAARLPSALAAIVCSAFTFKVLHDLNMRRAGLNSALVMIGSPLLVVIGHLCLTDMLFTSSLSVGILSLFARLSGLQTSYSYIGYFSLALAVLVKGPAAILFSGLILGAYSLNQALCQPGGTRWQAWWQAVKVLNPALAVLIILAVNVPWYLYETISSQWAFFNEFFIRQHLERAAGDVNHQRPWYYYFLVLSAGFAPWYVFLLGYSDVKRQVVHRHTRRANLAKLCAIWACIVVGVFSCSSAKLDTYVLPAVPPLAILSAMGLEYIVRLKQARRLRIIAAILAIAGVGGLIGIALSTGLWEDRSDLIGILLPLFVFAVLPNAVVVLTRSISRQVLVLSCSYALAASLGVACILHAYDEVKNRPLRHLISLATEGGGSLAVFMRDSPTVLFYRRKHVPFISTHAEYAAFRSNSPGPHFVLTTVDVAHVASIVCPGLTKVKATRKWWLFRSD